MGWGFMAHYGPSELRAYGTAEHWPAWLQINVARRAYYSDHGFYEWPNTARMCGLI